MQKRIESIQNRSRSTENTLIVHKNELEVHRNKAECIEQLENTQKWVESIRKRWVTSEEIELVVYKTTCKYKETNWEVQRNDLQNK